MEITTKLSDNEQLSIRVKFDSDLNGNNKGYRISVTKEFMKDGWIEVIPLATGNFNALIKKGNRKSQKQINLIGNFIADNIDILKAMWLKGDYNGFVEMVKKYKG